MQMVAPLDRLRNAETWLFDLDNTLYPAECNLFAEMERRMGGFIVERFKVDPEEAHRRRRHFFQTHGTTLRGLMLEHGIEPEDFLDYVHDIPLDALAPLPEFARSLAALPGRRLIFTNGTVRHAERVLEKLGLSGLFEDVFDIVASKYIPKPAPGPYEALIRRHGVNPADCVMVEDMARNLKPAAALGMMTVWVPTRADWSQPEEEAGYIHHVAPHLPAFLAEVNAAQPAENVAAG